MMHNMSIRNLHRILSLQSSNKCVHIYFNKLYSVMKIRHTNLTLLSCIQTNFSSQFITIKKLSTNCDIKMDGAGDKKSFTINYEGLLQAQKDSNVLIIDVREQKEIDETGKLPGSIHIPMGKVASIINLSDEEFKKEFEKSKPDKHTKIILSCRAGTRSGIVQEELKQLGYNNAYNYTGGWLEWESRQK